MTASTTTEKITARMARWAAGLQYAHLSAEAVHEAKRFLLDSLGCALGGYLQHDVRIALEVLDETAGRGPATVIGTGARMDPVSASLANALMVRVMDYNDIYWKQDPSHPSDIIPAAIACGERAGRDGRELIVGIVLGHEFEQRLCEAAFPGIRERGWHHATLTAFVSPIVAGRMLGLDAEQIQHAIGISAQPPRHAGRGHGRQAHDDEEHRGPDGHAGGVLAALLAERGYTGPEHVIDGKEGMVHCLGPEWKLEVLTEGLGESWRITQCGMKAFPTEALTHTPISAVLDIVREHDLKPDQIAKVHIRSLARAADILADPSKYDPRSKETADHSPAVRDRGGHRRPAGDPAAVHRREDPGPDDPRPAAQGRGGGRPRDREGLPGAAARHRHHPHERRAAVHPAARLPQGRPAQPAHRPRDRGEVRRPGRAGAVAAARPRSRTRCGGSRSSTP